jgi:hypothetical protein
VSRPRYVLCVCACVRVHPVAGWLMIEISNTIEAAELSLDKTGA